MKHGFKILNMFSTIVMSIMLGGSPSQIVGVFRRSEAIISTGSNFVYLPLIFKDYPLYMSKNLSTHTVSAERNPGGGTNCLGSQEDVRIQAYADYGEVTSNVQEIRTWVNAIGTKKFTDIFPSGTPIVLGVYRYSGEFSLPKLPVPDNNQKENPEAVHLMIQLWDGSNRLWQSNKTALEGTIYWDLNPWTPDGQKGRIKIYTKPLNLIPSGISLMPNTEWHYFDLVVDFVSQRYRSVTIDNTRVDLSNFELAQVYHPEWGNDLSFSITTESLSAWPQYDCQYVFKWTTRFKNLKLERVQ